MAIENSEYTKSSKEEISPTLVAYFSLTGEQYSVGVIDEGNTSIVAHMIAEKTGADLFEIESVEPYPDTYDVIIVAKKANHLQVQYAATCL